MTGAPAVTLSEQEAAELESSCAIDTDPEMIGLVMSFKAHRDARNNATKELEKLKAKLLKKLTAEGAQTLTLGGKVEARKSTVQTPHLDGNKLKQELPEIWAKYQDTTYSVRLTVAP